MSEEDAAMRRVRFYGAHDLATGWYISRVAELAERFDPSTPPTTTNEILELHNVQKYLEHGLLPHSCSEQERHHAKSQIPKIRSAVARFFSAIDETNFALMMTDVGYDYHGDLLELLARNKAFERCDGATVLPALIGAGVHLAEMLAIKKLVQAYDIEVRDMLHAFPQGAEILVRKYLQDDVRDAIYLPASLTPADARALLEGYVDGEDANPNYLGLIATAKETPRAGIDAKLKLRAKRRNEKITARFFDENAGFKTGCEVSISQTQEEPVVFEMDTSEGLVCRYTYSRHWLEATCDNPSILNNFLHLFDFTDRNGLLVLPAYPAQLGVMERVMGTTGKTEYKAGSAFRAIDISSLLQTRMYYHFLESKGIDLEQVISWFFEWYLPKEFDTSNFSFTPSGSGTSYLQKARHLFAEMESVANQFELFVKDGELDRDLLAMGSQQVRYKEIPSLLDRKYLYPSEGDEVVDILHLLFSDQSRITYINENLKGENAAMLLLQNQVAYGDFLDYQKPSVDQLIKLGVLEDCGPRVQFANAEQFLILRALFTTQAANYYHLSDFGRAEADAMVSKGWVKRRSSLLTEAEGRYFNYFLNEVEYSNGPKLRNKYLHGSQGYANDEDAHFNTYTIALRLTIALVIKMNDDFVLSASEKSRSDGDE